MKTPFKNLLWGALLLLATGYYGASETTKPVIVVSQIIEHPALQEVRDGILEYLKEHGLEPSRDFVWIYQNAQGNISTSAQIAKNLAAFVPQPKVFIAIGTPTAQSALAATKGKSIPILFAAVTDPIGGRLVESLEKGDPRISGVIDAPPLEELLSLIPKIVLGIGTIGLLYNPGEANSVTTIEDFKEIAKTKDLKTVEAPVTKAADLPLAIALLVKEGAQAIYVPQDNTVVAAMTQVVNLANASRIPVFASDSGSVKNGALAAVSYRYSDVGRKTGEYVKRLLEGERVENLKIIQPDDFYTFINTKTFQTLGIPVNNDLAKKSVRYPETTG
jgi:putative ABC transport system substrate-binding protein